MNDSGVLCPCPVKPAAATNQRREFHCKLLYFRIFHILFFFLSLFPSSSCSFFLFVLTPILFHTFFYLSESLILFSLLAFFSLFPSFPYFFFPFVLTHNLSVSHFILPLPVLLPFTISLLPIFPPQLSYLSLFSSSLSDSLSTAYSWRTRARLLG